MLDDSSASARAGLTARGAALQELEDERLERCRDAGALRFDQCFFFGPKVAGLEPVATSGVVDAAREDTSRAGAKGGTTTSTYQQPTRRVPT